MFFLQSEEFAETLRIDAIKGDIKMTTQLRYGLLDYFVLKILANEPSYVYKMIDDMKGVIEISESTLYPIVKRLTGEGLLESFSVVQNSRIRRYYKVTPESFERLKSFNEEWNDVQKVFQFIVA